MPSPVPAIVTSAGLLGWYDDGWVTPPADAADVPLTGGEQYRLVDLGGLGDVVVGEAPTNWCDPVPGSLGVDMEPDPWPVYTAFDPDPVAVAAEWNLMPRPVEILDPASTVYQIVAADFLATRGVTGIDPSIVQLLRTDIEGDGDDEVILVTDSTEEDFFGVDTGDHSVVLARSVLDGQVETSVLGEAVVPELAENEFPFIVVFRVAAIADLDGDGEMEIIVEDTYYEGAGASVWDWQGPDLGFVQVLSTGCGA